MSTFDDYVTAANFRDVLTQIVRSEINRERPAPRYATVTSINRETRRCDVLFPGETESVPVSMGAVQPLTTGQVVRIEGLMGNRFIADVMGPAFTTHDYPRIYRAATSGGPTSGTTPLIVGTLNVPAQSIPTVQHVSGFFPFNPDAAGSNTGWVFGIRDTNISGSLRGRAIHANAGDATHASKRWTLSIPLASAVPRSVPVNTPVTYVAYIENTLVTGGTVVWSGSSNSGFGVMVLPDLN